MCWRPGHDPGARSPAPAGARAQSDISAWPESPVEGPEPLEMPILRWKVARTLGLGRQVGGRELAGFAVEPRDVDALALAIGKPQKGRRVGAPVDEVLLAGGRAALCQKRGR